MFLKNPFRSLGFGFAEQQNTFGRDRRAFWSFLLVLLIFPMPPSLNFVTYTHVVSKWPSWGHEFSYVLNEMVLFLWDALFIRRDSVAICAVWVYLFIFTEKIIFKMPTPQQIFTLQLMKKYGNKTKFFLTDQFFSIIYKI